MSVKVKYSTHYKAVLSRLRRLPRIYEDLIEASLKRDAVGFIETYQNGLEGDIFRLERLKPATVDRKRSRGFPKPRVPLYGRGALERNSYYNLLRIQKVKNGYRVKARTAKHWDSELTLEHLYHIHENGAVFESQGRVIRIPARPAVAKARRRFFRELKKTAYPAVVQRAVGEYIRTGSTKRVQAEIRLAARRAKEHATRD